MVKGFVTMTAVSKSFDGVPVLKNVNFAVGQGEVVALMGENGAGKSTLMKILSGVYQSDEGSISIDGEKIEIRDVRQGMNAGIVLIHQELNLVDNLNVASNIFLGREPLGKWGIINQKKLYADAAEVLQTLGLKIGAAAAVDELSIGEQQMIEIAKAISQNARLLIMDEPTSSLTFTETQSLFKVIRDLTAKGVSIIYISHRLSEVYEIADRAVVLKDGRNSGELERDQINHENILRLMVGRSLSIPPPARTAPDKEYDFEVQGLRTWKYPESKVNLKVARREIVGIAGLMGAGRTELVNSIFGVTPATAGKIILNGKESVIRRPGDAISKGIYLVPEDRRKQGVITEMDVVDNITISHLGTYSVSKFVQKKLAARAARSQSDKLNIVSAGKNPLVKYLSGGNQQKVAIAKWLGAKPELLIFDEPTRGVDVGAKAEIYAIMRQIADAGSMILMVSSDMEEVMKISDRIIVMCEGEITGELLPEEFSEETIIRMAVAN